MAGKRIVSVRLKRETDCDPDLSFLGEYSNQAKSESAIDREERGDRHNHREYRFFNPAMTGEETGNPESPEIDYQRMEAYNAGQWCMVGVWAEAEIVVAGICQTIKSGGLWGIESDSDANYFREIEEEELNSLKTALLELGFSLKAIHVAFVDCKEAV